MITEVYKATKLKQELDTIYNRLHQENPLEDYYLKNADIMLKYLRPGRKFI